MAKVTFRSLTLGLVALLMLPFFCHGQSNPQKQYRDIIDKEFHYSVVNSAAMPTVIGAPSKGILSFEADPVSPDVYRFEYKPGKIEAQTKAVIEYWKKDDITGELKPDYTTFFFRISRSLISCQDDRRFISKNQSINGIQVLENDSRTDGPLVIDGIAYSEGGIATINGETIDFTPFPDFVGDAFVYYSVRDTKNKGGTGLLKIKVIDATSVANYGTIDIISYGGIPVELDLPFDGFQVSGEVQYGSFESYGGIQQFIPSANINASETFQIVKNNIVRDVNVQIIKKERSNSWVIDDIVYTSQGTEVNFDVDQNDLKHNQTITSASPELIPNAESGVYSYLPEPYFLGNKTFEYTVFNGFASETGKIFLKVSNFFPQIQYDYNFTTVGNSVLVIDYKIPISNFSFELISGPSNGVININSGNSTIEVGCSQIAGNNLVLYQPDYNFIGSDAFTLNYCVDGLCQEVEVKVQVVQNNLGDCECYTGCVWAGDANNDGLVNVVDLLSMAYSLGASGAPSDWNGGSGWIGRKTEDWNEYPVNGANPKFADADGNGIVEKVDFNAIIENYDKNHSLVPPQFLDNKSYPFTLKPAQDTIYIGDRIEFEIGIGNEAHPVLDAHGFAFSLGMPGNLVDSSSVNLEYYTNSWLAIDEAVYGMYKQLYDGWLETSVARLSSLPKSGKGPIGKLDFIVEEDVVGGFRVSDGIIPLKIYIKEGQVLSSDGQFGALEGTEATVYLNIKKEKSSNAKESRLIAFPNPATDILNLHMNGGHDILSYEMYDMMGKLVTKETNLETRNTSIHTSTYTNGIYFLKVQTTFGPIITKVEILK